MADNVIPFPGAEAEPDDAPPFSQADIQAITQHLIDDLGSPEAVLQALGAFGGFEPFGGRKVNASFQVARRVAELNSDRNINLLEVPVVWGAPEGIRLD